MKMENIHEYIDHTLLKADAKEGDILKLVEEAKKYSFYSVCVNSCYTKLVSEQLQGSGVKTTTVVGFPLGAMSKEAKVFETKQALEDGSDEIDMVLNIGALKDGRWDYVYEEIKAIKEVCGDRILKVIIETCLLTEEEKKKACELSVKAQADFVKTSTGFSNGGATLEDVKLMKSVVGDRAEVKASGGIRTREDALAMIKAGASRLGASSGIAIVTGK